MQRHYNLILTGLRCAACVNTVEKALRSVDGVTNVKVNFAQRSVLVTTSKDINPQQLLDAVTKLGYGAEIQNDHAEHHVHNMEKEQIKSMFQKGYIALFSGILLMILEWIPFEKSIIMAKN